MPTTDPTFGWPLPEATDPPDGPGQMTALAAGIAGTLTAERPAIYSTNRTTDAVISASKWGEAAGLSVPAAPPCALLILAEYVWQTAGTSCWFRIDVNGTKYPPGGVSQESVRDDPHLSSFHTVVAFAGGSLTVAAQFGFGNDTIQIRDGSRLTVLMLPQSKVVMSTQTRVATP